MAVADAELGTPVRLPIGLLEAGRLDEHWCDKQHRHMAVIGEDGEADHPVLGQLVAFCYSNRSNPGFFSIPGIIFSGKWTGATDKGEGSPHIRCRTIKQRLIDLLTFA